MFNNIINSLLSIFIIILFIIPSPIFAYENIQSGELITLDKNSTINKDYFACGEKVIISGTVNGDLYVGGGTVIIEGKVNGDLLVGGGNIIVSGNVEKDVRAAGGNIDIQGKVGGNITALGGNVNIASSANVGGSLVTASGNVTTLGPISKGITAATGALTVGNSVGGDILAATGDLTLTSQTKVNGNLTYISQNKADFQKEASVSGTVVQNLPPERQIENRAAKAAEIFTAISVFFALINFVSKLILGLLLIWLFPRFFEALSQVIENRPFYNLGIGFLTILITPFIILALLITLVGVPLAFILLFSFILLLYLSQIVISFLIGRYLFRKLGGTKNIYLALITGLILYELIGFLPIIGGITLFFATLIGLGGLLTTKRLLVQDLRRKELI